MSNMSNTRRAGVHQVFCDETGFTGNDLLARDQPYFAYAAVAQEHDVAKGLVERLIRDHRLQGAELKWKHMARSERGQRVIRELLEALQGSFAATVFDKKLSLAGKFFEYIFEPALQRDSLFFYRVGFHLFVMNMLNMHFDGEVRGAEEIMRAFQNFMRTRTSEALEAVFTPLTGEGRAADDMLAIVSDIAVGNKEAILTELDALSNADMVGKWVLDLTVAALNSLLAVMGERREVLDVFCDQSKPLEGAQSYFTSMVGNKNVEYRDFGKRLLPITYNLHRLPQLVDSMVYPGVQLADVVSGAAATMFHSRRKRQPNAMLEDLVGPHLTMMNVLPDLDHVDLSQKEPFLNSCLLRELHDRARINRDPVEGIRQYYAFLSRQYDINPPNI